MKTYQQFIGEAKSISIHLKVGDEIKVGRFKNRRAIIKSFKTDDHNQPVAVTDKGEQKILKCRISALEPPKPKKKD